MPRPIAQGGGEMTEPENVLRAFSENHLVRLTGLSKSQLRYWDKTGFFCPRYAYENRRSPYSRVYSFRDVVGLRTLAVLRKEHKVSLQHLRRVAQELSDLHEDLWAETTLYVLSRKVYFHEPDTGLVRRVVDGQYAMIPLVRIINAVEKDVNKLKERPPEQIGKLERNRHVARNAWVHAGTRIPVRIIARFKEAGYSNEKIMREYPTLTEEDIETAMRHEEVQAKQA